MKTVHYSSQKLDAFLDHRKVPNLNITKFRIHSDLKEYVRWKHKLPVTVWPMYGLDKPFWEDLKKQGVVGKAAVLENLKK
jgi:hypothetical protein